jgi:uncharacterized membrane protein
MRPLAERNALWLALGAIALAGALVAVGVRVAPETFYDHYWWEDIWGPLVVDAHQCRTSVDPACASLGPPGVLAKDGYTLVSELTYGAVLAVMLYGIYVGVFRRYGIVADARFVLALVPWMLVGPVGRVLEDADVFCRAGTRCDPGPFAYVFISPVIYIAIAVCVLAAMLVGVAVERRRYAEPETLTIAVGGVLLGGLLLFAGVALYRASWFTALPPVWAIALACAGALWLFHARARRGLATMNLVVLVLGVPFAAGVLWLVGRWLAGARWSDAPWGGAYFRDAGLFVLAVAILVAGLVWALARALVEYGVERRLARAAQRVPHAWDPRVGYAGIALLVLAFLMTGALPALGVFATIPRANVLIPLCATAGGALLAAYALLALGRGAAAQPGALYAFAAPLNVGIVAAHVMDGMATWVALADPLGFGIPQYGEKHPVGEFLLGYWGGFLFPFTKLALVLVVVWVLDRETKSTTPDERNMVGLVKMAILALGFGPGLRDTLRLAMGV